MIDFFDMSSIWDTLANAAIWVGLFVLMAILDRRR
jgi:hypothetical protein